MKSFPEIIKNGGIAVIKTDTLYGLVTSAYNRKAVDTIYHIKKRDLLKACVVLVSSILDIEDMGFVIRDNVKKVCQAQWPGKVSIIIDTPDELDLHYLHRGTGGIAFRVPDDERLRKLLHETGPLLAPSANPEKQPPAQSIAEAMAYFGDSVNYYMDDGICDETRPSRIIRVHDNGDIQVVRDSQIS